MIPKFRVWDVKNLVWFKADFMILCDGLLYINLAAFDLDTCLEPDEYVFQMATGYKDKDDDDIYAGDITMLKVDGVKRFFEVQIKQVIRKVKSHPDFYDEYAKVALMSVVFIWEGYELFPCVDKEGVIDTSRMKIVGNILENPDLLEVAE